MTGPGSIQLGAYSGEDVEAVHYFDNVIVDQPLTVGAPLSEVQAWFNANPLGGDRRTAPPEAQTLTYPGGDVSYLRTLGPHLLAAALELLNVPPLPYTVSPGSSFTFDVRYAPTAETPDAATVIIGSNDEDEPEVEVAVSGQGLMPALCSLYFESLDTDPGWATQGGWAYGVPLGACGDPASGYTGTHVYGYNLAGCYSDNMAAYSLTAGPMDCSGQTGVRLRFWRWLGVESSAWDHAAVQVSKNGTNWTDVWTHTGGTLTDTSWVQCEYDISAVADEQPTVYIRWVIGPSDYSVTYAGWNIDDIELLAICTDDLSVSPGAGFVSSGYEGGPFTPDAKSYTLRDNGSSPLDWSASADVLWLDLSTNMGTLAPAESAVIDVSFNANAASLLLGTHSGTVTFTNTGSGVQQTRGVRLDVLSLPGEIAVSDSVSPGDDLSISFGQLILGTQRTEQITVHNLDSARNLIVSGIALGGGPAVYAENFDDGLAQDWEPTDPAQWAVVSGEYRAQAGSLDTMMQSSYTGADWADLSVQVTMRRTGSETAASVLFARASADFDLAGMGSAYVVGIDATGYFLVLAWPYVLQDWTYSPYLNAGAATNDVLLSVSDSTLKVSFNGSLAWSATDSSLTGPGAIGLGAYSGFDTEAVHYFDDVIVGAPLTTAAPSKAQAWYNAHPYSGGDLRRAPDAWKPPAYPGGEVFPQPGAPPLRAAVFELRNLPSFPQTVGPGGSFTFDIRYAPNAAKTDEATVTIASNDQDEPEVEILLSGEGYGGQVVSFYAEPLDTDPGWTTEGAWAYGVPLGACGDPASGYTGTHVYGYNLAGCYPDYMAAYSLTTGPIDCSDQSGVRLRFWRWLGVESSTWDHAAVQVSNNGTSWTDVWTHSGSTVIDDAWIQQEYDISAVADNEPAVYIRWGMGPTDSSVTYGGWNIDDIEILGYGGAVGPVAAFTATPTFGQVPLLVQFTDRSTAGSAPIVDWAWDFGDGSTSYDQNPTHLFEEVGNYTVTLTVTTVVKSDTKTASHYIMAVEEVPVAGLAGLAVLAVALALGVGYALRKRP